MRRPVVTVTIRNEQGDVLHSEKRSAFNAGIRASEDAVREIARAAHTTYEADRPSRVGDVYTRRWVSRDGRAIIATIEKEPETTMEARKDDEQILNAAEKAGIRYANDQLGSDYFMDWVREQVAEAEQMRRNDPSSVMPTETKSQARKVARNMLQQLEWDTKRELNVLDYVSAGDVKPEEVVKKFYEGFDWALRGDPAPGDQKVEDWLADEILALSGEARGGGARETRRERTPSIDMYQEAQIFINGKYQVGFTFTPSRGPMDAAREVLSIARDGDTIEVKQEREVWTYKVTRQPGKPATIVEVHGGVREAYGRGRYGRRSGGGGDTPRWKQDEEEWQRQRTEYQPRSSRSRRDWFDVRGEKLLRSRHSDPDERRSSSLRSATRAGTTNRSHTSDQYPGFGYGENGGLGQTYFVEPAIVPAGKETREASTSEGHRRFDITRASSQVTLRYRPEARVDRAVRPESRGERSTPIPRERRIIEVSTVATRSGRLGGDRTRRSVLNGASRDLR